MSSLEQRLLNNYQRNFPLVPQPYEQLAGELGSDSQTVRDLLAELLMRGKVSRVGPVFKPRMLGSSTLAAMSVPQEMLTEVATLVNGYPEVNHNYEREHRLNLWFVAVAADQEKLEQVLSDIESRSGYEVMSLPLLKEYHIDLGFRMDAGDKQKVASNTEQNNTDCSFDPALHGSLIAAIQTGLPLTERPYLTVGEQLDLSEETVIETLSEMQSAGIIRRLGVIVRHHELGYRANAMLVWDVPDDQVDALGQQLSAEQKVTLCYQRPRIKPRWPYNLFSMIHGKSRDEVMAYVDDLVDKLALKDTPYEVLFSLQRFKQCGAKYIVQENVPQQAVMR
ncbi:siroheme decarboxylase subunit beta [Aliamphritea ceti]|uniref:siroheme decarboxylase subunit beta n=1 Tax=Aliamphritea ceti TaxID=1524258 RepID=UPI0021C28D64|nr:hypothetical protein [Aliamphritea ceti]